jgi:hypothetical protein
LPPSRTTRTRPERYKVDFSVFLSWQDRHGLVRRIAGRCIDLSAAGAQVEIKDQLAAQTMVLLNSEFFGRMGHASVRYCRRMGMKYKVGLHFTSLFQLSDPARKSILEKVLQKTDSPAPGAAPETPDPPQ